MDMILTPQLEEYVKKKIESGEFNSSSEFVQAALRLLEEQDRLREMRLEDLRKEIQPGIDQADRGELTPGEEVFRRLRERNKQSKKRTK